MAIPTIEGLGAPTAVQAQQVAVRKTETSAEGQGAIAPRKAAGGASGAPPAGGAGGSASASESTNYDKKDTNRDGVVSALEELAYDLKHPAALTGSLLDVRA